MINKPLTRKKAHSPFRKCTMRDARNLVKKFDKNFFEDKNYNYQEWHQDQSKKIVAKIAQCIPLKKNWVFLDVGCALGGIVEILRRRGLEAYGIDVSRYCLKNSPVGKYLQPGSASHIPCADQSVDVSICIDTFQYLNKTEARAAARELRRITRKYLCFESITREDEKHSNTKDNPDVLRKHSSLLTKEEYIALFEKEGFTLKKKSFLPRKIEGSVLKNREYYEYEFSFNAIFEVS